MEPHIWHLPTSYLHDQTCRTLFALRMANLHLAFDLIRRFKLATPQLISSWEEFHYPAPVGNPIHLDAWPMKGVNNLLVIMETLRDSCGQPIFAFEGTFYEPWALWYLAAAMAQTWTRDPFGRMSGVPDDVSTEELKRLTEELDEEIRKVSAKIWRTNFAYFQRIIDYRWYDKQMGNLKESYDGGRQDGIGQEESEHDAETGVQNEVATEVRSDKDHDSAYWSMEEETREDGNNADDDDDISSDDEAALTPSTESDVGETECRQEREWPRELEWHPGFGPCPKIDSRDPRRR